MSHRTDPATEAITARSGSDLRSTSTSQIRPTRQHPEWTAIYSFMIMAELR